MSQKTKSAAAADNEEEEDDYGCYFLRPVNEYKLADKIIEANRELFGADYDPSATADETHTGASAHADHDARPALSFFASIEVGAAADGRRRVTFRRMLEDFEPDFITDCEDDDEDDASQEYSESEVESESETVRKASPATASPASGRQHQSNGRDNSDKKHSMMLDSPRRRRPDSASVAASVDSSNNNNDDDDGKVKASVASASSSSSGTKEAVVATPLDVPTICTAPSSPVSSATTAAVSDSDSEIDEICEVIEEFGLASTNEMLSGHKPSAPLATMTSGGAGTGCRDDALLNMTTTTSTLSTDVDSDDGHSSGHSSSADSQPERQRQTAHCSGQSKRSHSAQEDTHPTRPKSSSNHQHNSQQQLPPQRSHSQQSSTHHTTSSSNQHRKVHTTQQQHHRGMAAASNDQRMKIPLNFKPCCELKNADAAAAARNLLPRYCGYVSQYGLSKEQLDQRAARRDRLGARRETRVERRTAEESNKSRVNEEAFARWLALKMRASTRANCAPRNMYDFVPAAAKRTPSTATSSKGGGARQSGDAGGGKITSVSRK